MKKTVIAVFILAAFAAVITAVLMQNHKEKEKTMAYHRMNLDTQEDVSFATKAECVGSVAWTADPPYSPSGYKCYKDGEEDEPCAFRDNDGFAVAECEDCVRTDKPNIEAVQVWLNNHLP